MDYARIYREFIADRLKKQPEAPEYFERHHILPRALGGGDEPANMIRLTPEDHLFAHLLLAKIHGGSMWAAVHAMCHLVNDSTKRHRRFARRTEFGHVRRALARYFKSILSGPCGKIADQTVYTLRHMDGRQASGNRFDLERQTGVPRQQISALLLGSKKTNRGWYCTLHNPNGLTKSEQLSIKLRSDEVFTLYHHDGREWVGTKLDFQKQFGANLYFQTKNGDVQGWHRTRMDAEGYESRLKSKARKAADARGNISGAGNPNADKSKYRFLVLETGDVVDATKIEAKHMFGVDSAGLCALFSGRQRKTRGIALA